MQDRGMRQGDHGLRPSSAVGLRAKQTVPCAGKRLLLALQLQELRSCISLLRTTLVSK